MPRTAYDGVVPTASPVLPPTGAQAPAANTAAVLTLAAPSDGSAWHLAGLRWSYSGAPAGGLVTVAWADPVAGAVSESYPVVSGGPGFVPYYPTRFPPNTAVTVTLAAGGAGVLGRVYADAWQE